MAFQIYILFGWYAFVGLITLIVNAVNRMRSRTR